MSYVNYQKESLKIDWYEFTSGNGIKYEFGISEPPFFMNSRCDKEYLMIILPNAYYPFLKSELRTITENTINSYHCEKLKLSIQDATEIFMFIKNIIMKGER